MLTIYDILQLPAFKEATLVAGRAGQDRKVNRVHIVDIPDAKFKWAKGDELLLTAGFGLRDAPEKQERFIARLVEYRLSGLVLSVGHYLHHTPDVMIQEANRLAFPIIELPPAVPFIDITEAIFARVINEQYAVLHRTEQIHHTLTQRVLDGGSLQDVAEELASILERSITIESVSFEVLATAQRGNVDQARTHSVNAGRTSPNIAQHLIQRGIYDQLLKERRPVRLPAIPELGMEMERIVAPIIVANKIIGYVWIIAGDHPLTDLDELALEHAATVAALIMFNERAVQSAEMRVRGDLLTYLLSTRDIADPTLVEYAHRLNFSLDQKYQVLAVHSYAPGGEGPSTLLSRIESFLDERCPALVVARASRLVIVLRGHHLPDGANLARQMQEALTHPAEQILLGVGRSVDSVLQLCESYEQATEALDIGYALRRIEGVITFDELGVLHWLRHLSHDLVQDNIYIIAVHKLADYDSDHKSDLLQTLETYLDVGTVSADAATTLHVHRNTLAYRLERIEQITALSLKNPNHRLNLHVAIKSYRLTGA